MKKAFAVILSILILFAFVSCGKGEDASAEAKASGNEVKTQKNT